MTETLRRLVSNTQISQKIALVTIVAGASILFLTLDDVRNRYADFSHADRVQRAVSVAKPLFDLQHELQKEKGQSFGFAATRSAAFRDTLLEQQRITDNAESAVVAVWPEVANLVGSSENPVIPDIQRMLRRLDDTQRQVNEGSADEGAIGDYYDPLLEAIDTLGHAIFEGRTTSDISALLANKRLVSNLKAIASVERALGANFFASGASNAPDASRLPFIAGAQQSLVDMLLASLPAADGNLLAQSLEQPAAAALDDMRFALEDFLSGEPLSSVGSTQWFNAASVLLNSYRDIELSLEAQIAAIAADREQSALARFYISAAIGLFTILVIAVLGVVLVRDIVRQVGIVLADMDYLANGDLDRAVSGLDRGDEFGRMASSLNYFRERLIDNRRLEAEAKAEAERRLIAEQQEARDREALREDELAQEDAARRQRREEIAALGERFRQFVDDGLQTVETAGGDVNDTAAQFTDASTQSKILAGDAVRAADDAAAHVEGLETAAAEIEDAIRIIDDSVKISTEKARSVVATVDASDKAIKSLDQSSREIQAVVDGINDIAHKTRMLALNATIEAARAGEAGKGFAVVANEVKDLADQTAGMTDQIVTQVDAISTQSADASRSMEKVVEAVSDVESSVADIQRRIDQQSEATREIREKSSGATEGARQASSGIGDVDQELSHTQTRAAQLSTASEQLNEQARKMRAALNDFIGELHA